ncbi:class I SAM-dependent methyltransferase [Saccharothrix mutabilis subsp. mutabilis]|uniref:Class I SAM-dependent methyltransferase n=2 Tax=Saccharothrix mutabilis TaxID=33921 RepID=A0ABP3CMT6_9PSEU
MPIMDEWLADTAASYDTVAGSYAEFVRGALEREQYLSAALTVFAGAVRAAGGGPVADVGCGPGQVTAHLRGLGVDAFGVDLSPGMVELARREHPGVRFEVGSMTALELPAGSVAGVLAWWSLIHVPDDEVPVALGEFRRVVRPGGLVQLGFHVGDVSRLKTEGYGGHPMRVHVHRRRPEKVAGWLREAGFAVDAQWLMQPDTEVPQAILFARREP